MAIIKCKMCGGDLNIVEDSSVCECEYCGTKQTVPKVDDEKKLKLFERANRLRTACEFDKAAGVYESIIADFDQEAEAYWGLILCKFGIEYVDDPATGNKVPTCHRSSFDSLMDDPNFDMVMECADPIARRVYREEARQIEELRKRIIEVSAKEEPYDVFISYKELDEDGQRTLDSVIAQDIYTELTDRGYRVFFSRISLEDKLGVEYEPYIFAALNSAKVMLVVGTDFDYFNAVWVKNEWSRFLALIASGQKKTLIPVFKGIDAYDMPKEFRKLAAQDMGKVGAMQDLVRGVEKLVGKKSAESPKEQPVIVQSGGPSMNTLLDRGYMSLEDGNWDKATELFDQILSMDPHSAKAYLGLAMAEMKCGSRDAFQKAYTSPGSGCRENKNLARSRQFGSDELRQWLEDLDREANAALKASSEKVAARREIVSRCKPLFSAGYYHTLGLRTNGTVIATKITHVFGDHGQCNLSDWSDLVAVAAGFYHSVGLKADGTVVATKYTGDSKYYHGQCELSDWRDIIAVSTKYNHTVGLKENGKVVAEGSNLYGQCNVSGWSKIIAIDAGYAHTVGLRADGTVALAGNNPKLPKCDVSGWSDIVAISAGHSHVVGLRADGTVVASGDNSRGQCEVSGWSDIVDISAATHNTIGLKADGTVVSTQYVWDKNLYCGQCEVSGWSDIVAVSAGDRHTVGLRANGTLISTAILRNIFDDGQTNVRTWKLFSNCETVEAERKTAMEKAAAERREAEEAAEAARKAAAEYMAEAERRAATAKAEAERRAKTDALNKEKSEKEARKAALERELPTLTGIFKAGKRKEAEAELAKLNTRLAEIEAELKKLG